LSSFEYDPETSRLPGFPAATIKLTRYRRKSAHRHGHDESAYVAGLPVGYFTRQLADWKNGDRKYSGIMISLRPVVEKLSNDDMLAIAAYVASRAP
jgi:cytochrome c553